MKDIFESFKKNFVTYMFLLITGFGIGKAMTYNNILTDCRVLGMFRVSDTPVGCRVGEAYK